MKVSPHVKTPQSYDNYLGRCAQPLLQLVTSAARHSMSVGLCPTKLPVGHLKADHLAVPAKQLLS